MSKFIQSKRRLGEHLVAEGLLTQEQLDDVLALQKQWGSRMGDVILAKGLIRPFIFYNALADHYQRPFINLVEQPPDRSLFNEKDITNYSVHLVVPWKKEENGKLILAIADLNKDSIGFALERYGENIDFVITAKFDVIWSIQENAKTYLSEQSTNDLAIRRPEQSAREVFTAKQLIGVGVIGYIYLTVLTLWPVEALIFTNALISFFLLINFGLRAVLTWVGGDTRIDTKVNDYMVEELQDQDLPEYTILVPMYKEPDTLPIIAAALRKLDYPLSKLDVKLILEEDDEETIEAAKNLGLEGIYEIIRVPDSLPKTKPKACNYALYFSRGEFVTIYDAEDKPEPDQLKRVVIAFRNSSPETACIQARLNYFNKDENWLTRLFTLEYSLWFDFYLPALEYLRIPIPLGGTSNHFKMKVLREVDAWDPYNVTEDADLGVRITQLGYRVGVVNSTTYEEANQHLGNWIRQRSRWIKGYMQTYLVHMRRPLSLYKTLGHVGFWGFQFFIGGTIVNALLSPILLTMFLSWVFTQSNFFDFLFPPLLMYISLFNLLFGNGFFVYLTALSAYKRHNFSLMPYALTVPAYWLLQAAAAYKALWQLIYKPFYWEKTRHGLSSYKHDDLMLEKEVHHG